MIVAILVMRIESHAQTPFAGHAGAYYLGTAQLPVPQSAFQNGAISGVVCRFRWSAVEVTPGSFDWSYVDAELDKARQAGKKLSLQPLGYPSWVIDDLHAAAYYSIDKNRYHATYGMIQRHVLPWDPVYLERVRLLLTALASKYSRDTVVSYVNAIGGQISRNLPDSIVTDTTARTMAPFWTAHAYRAESLAAVMSPIIDSYMTLFPSTPLWCSVDYVSFETRASGKPPNHLASLYTAYGLARYPDRFGIWREDISGCTPYATVNPGSQWRIMKEHPCRTGAQALWSVQDGPTRMNQCGLTPNTKAQVLRAAGENGLAFGMRYIEVYGADVGDPDLSETIAWADSALRRQGTACIRTDIWASLATPQCSMIVFPNPSHGIITLEAKAPGFDWTVFDLLGNRRRTGCAEGSIQQIDLSGLPHGVYGILILSRTGMTMRRIAIDRL